MATTAMSFAPRLIGFAASIGTLSAILLSQKKAHASGDDLHAPDLPWFHNKMWHGYDHASLRRGFQVYKEVCSACHSLSALTYRHLIDVCLTEDEVKALIAEVEVEDGPNEEGEMFTRPGKITDPFPKPYPNDKAARAGNGGALPPDLTYMTRARVDGTNYVYSLLTGYKEPPAGIVLREGLYYNPYMVGGSIAMAQALMNGAVTYEDGTEATISQMAKDVTTFLTWTAAPELEERKRFSFKAMFLIALIIIPTIYAKRQKWSLHKTRKIRFF
jgi:ubiquinol-cytochrome c reductase cytochrome c1 subunit